MGTAASNTPVAPDGHNKLDQHRWAIVVVPGFMGSRVISTTGSIEIWNPDSGWWLAKAILMPAGTMGKRLDPSQTPGRARNEDSEYKKVITADRLARGYGTVAWDYYGAGILALETHFAQHGGIVFACGYDWRQSNKKSGQNLLKFIHDVVKGEFEIKYKPIVVTHSMGGLVTRSACRQDYGGTKGTDLIAAVIHTFHPTYGAPEAYAKGRMGDPSTLGLIIGGDPETAAKCSYGIESAAQVLPNHLYTGIAHQDSPKWLDFPLEVFEKSDLANDPTLASQAKTDFEGLKKRLLADPYRIYKDESGWLGILHWVIKSDNYKSTRVRQGVLFAESFQKQLLGSSKHPKTWNLYGTALKTTIGVTIGKRMVYSPHEPGAPPMPLYEEPVTTRVSSTRGDETVADAAALAFEGKGLQEPSTQVKSKLHSKGVNQASSEIITLIGKALGTVGLIPWGQKTDGSTPPDEGGSDSGGGGSSGRDRRAIKPINPAANDAANEAVWKEMDRRGEPRRQLTMSDADYEYRTMWMDAYIAAGGAWEYY